MISGRFIRTPSAQKIAGAFLVFQNDALSARKKFLISLLLLLGVFFVFRPVLNQSFVNWDDNINLYENPYLQSSDSRNLTFFWQHPYAETYRPLIYTIWFFLSCGARAHTGVSMPGIGVSALDPHVFHLANLGLHAANALMVYALIRLLLPCLSKSETAVDWPAWVGAAVFAVHPNQVEAVAWVTGMNDTLCTFFSLLALWHYVCSVSSRQRSVAHYWGATLCYVLAILTKPSAVALPMLALLLDCLVVGRTLRVSLRSLAVWIGLTIPWILVTQMVRPTQLHLAASPLWERPFMAGDALTFYFWHLVFPVGFAPDYGRTPGWLLSHSWGYFTGFVPIVVALLLWRGQKRFRGLLVGLAFFCVGVLPVLGFVPNTFQYYSTVADRYAYFPLVGIAFAVAWILREWSSRSEQASRNLMLLSAFALLALGTLSARQIPLWNDTESMAARTLAVNPRSWVMHTSLGAILGSREQEDAAVFHYREALRWQPEYGQAYYNLGTALAKQGHRQEATAVLEQAVRFDHSNSRAYCNLGMLWADQGKLTQARSAFENAVKLNPAQAEAFYGLGLVDATMGFSVKAIEQWNRAVQLNPNYFEAHYNLGIALLQKKRMQEATGHFQRVLQLRPNFVPARNALKRASASIMDARRRPTSGRRLPSL